MVRTIVTADTAPAGANVIWLRPRDTTRIRSARPLAMACVGAVSLGFWIAVGHSTGLL